MNLFRNVTDATTIQPNEVICRQGDRGATMYAIVDGTVEVEINGIVIETLTAGDCFGEMSLIDQSPRSATVRAKSECRVAVIDERRFLFMVQQTPFFALQLMRTLTERLRRRLNDVH